MLPSRRLPEGDDAPNIEPNTVMDTEPEVGPFDRKSDEHRRRGGAKSLRKYADVLGNDTTTKFAPSASLEGDLQVKPVSECQREILHTDESRCAAMEIELRAKDLPLTKHKVAPVPGGAVVTQEETLCLSGDKCDKYVAVACDLYDATVRKTF